MPRSEHSLQPEKPPVGYDQVKVVLSLRLVQNRLGEGVVGDGRAVSIPPLRDPQIHAYDIAHMNASGKHNTYQSCAYVFELSAAESADSIKSYQCVKWAATTKYAQ